MKLNKKILVCVGVVCLGLTGCTGGENKPTNSEKSGVDITAYKEIESAVNVLKNKTESYIVETAVEMPDESFTYIEVNTSDGNYTEYSVDEDGNFGTLNYGASDGMQYVLMDLISSDGYYYSFNTVEDELQLNIYPDEYKEWVDGRALLYVGDMLDSFTSLKKQDSPIDVVLDDGEMQLTAYSGVLKADKVQEILSNNNIGIYKSLIESEEDGSNVQKLCEQYLKESEMLMTFSDANVMIGVDASGCLRYMGFETGGLGQRMYYTKVLINPNNTNFRDLPDLSGAVALRENYVETADYVAGFSSYEDAMHALDYHDGMSAEEFYEPPASTEESTETDVETSVSEVESSSEVETNASEVNNNEE